MEEVPQELIGVLTRRSYAQAAKTMRLGQGKEWILLRVFYGPQSLLLRCV
jgi:hypothetical protein